MWGPCWPDTSDQWDSRRRNTSRLRFAPNYLLLGMVQVSTWAYSSICTLTRLFGKKDRIHQANPNNINKPLSTVFWPRFPQANVGKWMANAIEWGCPSIHLLGVLYLPLLPSIPSRKSRKCSAMFSRSQVRNVWRSFHQLPGDVLALHSAQAISGQTRQNLVHFPERDRVPKAMQNFLRKFNFATKKRQSPCVLGAGGLGQSADDFLCPDFTRCKFQMIVDYHTLIHTIWINNMIQYGSIR